MISSKGAGWLFMEKARILNCKSSHRNLRAPRFNCICAFIFYRYHGSACIFTIIIFIFIPNWALLVCNGGFTQIYVFKWVSCIWVKVAKCVSSCISLFFATKLNLTKNVLVINFPLEIFIN